MSYRGLTSMLPVATPTAKPTAGTMTVRRAATSHMSKPPDVVPLVYRNSDSVVSGSDMSRRYLTRDSDWANKRLVRSAGDTSSSLIMVVITLDLVTHRRGRELRASIAGLDVDRRTGKGDDTKAVFIFLLCFEFVFLGNVSTVKCLSSLAYWLVQLVQRRCRNGFKDEWRRSKTGFGGLNGFDQTLSYWISQIQVAQFVTRHWFLGRPKWCFINETTTVLIHQFVYSVSVKKFLSRL